MDSICCFFFFNDTATTEIYTLSLHDALPISGTPVEHMALGAFFSAAEVIPLTFLTVEAWSFLRLGKEQEAKSSTPFPHRYAILFLVSVGFWNFLGAGVFGFLINLPIVSYYEIGTALTSNHGHAAMMGVYGMLAVGLALFCLRRSEERRVGKSVDLGGRRIIKKKKCKGVNILDSC